MDFDYFIITLTTHYQEFREFNVIFFKFFAFQYAARNMLMAISDGMHNNLMESFKTAEDRPLTLLLDSSSDKANLNQLSTLFMFFEEGQQPQMYHYRLLEFGHQGSGE